MPQVESTFQGEYTRPNEIRSSQVQLLAKCWFPIIDAFGACVKDPRQPAIVKLHALAALRNAVLQNNYSLILERFLPEEMHRILIEVFFECLFMNRLSRSSVHGNNVIRGWNTME